MAEFTREDLRGSRFERVDLTGAEFVASDLCQARFRGVDFRPRSQCGVQLFSQRELLHRVSTQESRQPEPIA
jgi:uncharacterized protein YjbI with pentapeptide repeats